MAENKMADEKLPQFSESADLARARAFWKENGKSIIFGIAFGLAGIVGFNYWKHYEQSQGENASALFEQASPDSGSETAAEAGGVLKEKHADSTYASLAAFYLAKRYVEEEKLAEAADELRWVVDNSAERSIAHIARLRLAAVLLADDKQDKAIEILADVQMDGYESRHQELLGDAYIERNQDGDRELARASYVKSIDRSKQDGEDYSLIQLKLDNVGDN